jgi:hypothetical protein
VQKLKSYPVATVVLSPWRLKLRGTTSLGAVSLYTHQPIMTRVATTVPGRKSGGVQFKEVSIARL